MTLKNEPRREPSLADLEAFERLLRDSLKADGPEAAQAQVAQAQPSEAAPPAPPPQPAITADNALAEFNRLVEAPVVFEQPGEPPSVSRISAIEQALRADLDKPASTEPAPALPRDPLLDFEEELRRFEAMSRPAAPLPANPVEPIEPLRGGYAGDAQMPSGQAATASMQAEWMAPAQPIVIPEAAQPDAHEALAAAESRLTAEAEAAAYAGGAAMAAGAAAGGAKRSRGIFLALGGVAVAGLAVIGGVTAFSGSKSNQTASNGKVPVVAAKPEPAKEKPANPGGLEVPDQNKQVLAARNAPAADSRPAQVVNQTEQPVDLNQIARRDSVRIVAPNPFQPTPGTAASGETPAATAPGTTPAPVPGEPRRVQSVRIADPVAPPPAVTPASPPSPTAQGIGAGSIAAIAAGTAIAARPSTPPAALPPGGQAAIRPTAPATPPTAIPTPPTPAAAAPVEAPKVETRPQSPVTPPRPTTTANPPPRPAANNAPLPLNPNRPATPPAAAANAPANPAPRVATAPAAAGGGAFAIQLASRPTEADAQNAGRQLGQRFSGQIGGKAPVVVRGEANGQTVYRVRVTGFAQSEAASACDRIRAAGGACFVTRQ
ncbi:MAG: SPOR domain-containing protein [Beijerinckiaceae bacterium]|nr:SPOR domain-containing protein [Beijerinckiaceae bacterium]